MRKWIDPVPALKRQLAREIVVLIDGWSQSYAAWFTHLSRSRISEMRRGNLENVSLERLVQCATHLGRVVELVTRRAPGPSVHPHDQIDRSRNERAGGRCTSGSGFPEL